MEAVSSLLSIQGKHIGPVIKALRPDCGVYGNHDFDFGVEELVKLAAQCELPWVMTNVVDASKGVPLLRTEGSMSRGESVF